MGKTNLDENQILELYNSGTSSIKIAEMLGCADSTVRNRLKKLGVSLRDNTFYRKFHTWDDNFFENIDTEEKSYWLGFMYADGNVRQCHNSYYIKLAVADFEVIERFKKDLKASHKIGKYVRKTKGKDLYYLIISSKKMAFDLIRRGCIVRKSLALTFPTTIPEHLVWHFIRGYFDGDGCLCSYIKRSTQKYKNKTITYEYPKLALNICGTQEFLTELQKYIVGAKLYKEKRKSTNCYRLESQHQQYITDFCKNMYKDATIYLSRKYQKFIDFQKKTFNDHNTAPV